MRFVLSRRSPSATPRVSRADKLRRHRELIARLHAEERAQALRAAATKA